MKKMVRRVCFRKGCPPTWTCRVCGKMCCEHRCSLKITSWTALGTKIQTAVCQKCKK